MSIWDSLTSYSENFKKGCTKLFIATPLCVLNRAISAATLAYMGSMNIVGGTLRLVFTGAFSAERKDKATAQIAVGAALFSGCVIEAIKAPFAGLLVLGEAACYLSNRPYLAEKTHNFIYRLDGIRNKDEVISKLNNTGFRYDEGLILYQKETYEKEPAIYKSVVSDGIRSVLNRYATAYNYFDKKVKIDGEFLITGKSSDIKWRKRTSSKDKNIKSSKRRSI